MSIIYTVIIGRDETDHPLPKRNLQKVRSPLKKAHAWRPTFPERALIAPLTLACLRRRESAPRSLQVHRHLRPFPSPSPDGENLQLEVLRFGWFSTMRPHAARLAFWFARRSLRSKLLDESPIIAVRLCWIFFLFSVFYFLLWFAFGTSTCFLIDWGRVWPVGSRGMQLVSGISEWNLWWRFGAFDFILSLRIWRGGKVRIFFGFYYYIYFFWGLIVYILQILQLKLGMAFLTEHFRGTLSRAGRFMVRYCICLTFRIPK